ncbi:MAG: hypothetical protein L6R38_009079 [Xanthoria sp. 2 TBL-2021]|nr:MAG: hypothetical protein L6R38_009079 [Xanthoria sp. 2 TBL-2021]
MDDADHVPNSDNITNPELSQDNTDMGLQPENDPTTTDADMTMIVSNLGTDCRPVLEYILETFWEYQGRLKEAKETANDTTDQMNYLTDRMEEAVDSAKDTAIQVKALADQTQGTGGTSNHTAAIEDLADQLKTLHEVLAGLGEKQQMASSTIDGKQSQMQKDFLQSEQRFRELAERIGALQDDVTGIQAYASEKKSVENNSTYEENLETATDRLGAFGFNADPPAHESGINVEQEIHMLQDTINNEQAQILALRQILASDKDYYMNTFNDLADLLQIANERGAERQNTTEERLGELGGMVTTALQQSADAVATSQVKIESHAAHLEERLESLETSIRENLRSQWEPAMQTLRQHLTEQIERQSHRSMDEHDRLQVAFDGLEQEVQQQGNRLTEGQGSSATMFEGLNQQLHQQDQRVGNQIALMDRLSQEVAARFEQQSNTWSAEGGALLMASFNHLREWTEQERRGNQVALTSALNEIGQELIRKVEGMATAQARDQPNSTDEPRRETAAQVEEMCSVMVMDKTKAMDDQMGDVVQRLHQQEKLSSTLKNQLTRAMNAVSGTIDSGLSRRVDELAQQIRISSGPAERTRPPIAPERNGQAPRVVNAPSYRDPPQSNRQPSTKDGEKRMKTHGRQVRPGPPIVGHRRCQDQLKGGDCTALQPRGRGEKEEAVAWYCGRHVEARWRKGGVDVLSYRIRKPKGRRRRISRLQDG